MTDQEYINQAEEIARTKDYLRLDNVHCGILMLACSFALFMLYFGLVDVLG